MFESLFVYLIRLHEDTAWLPVMKEDIESAPALRKALIFAYGPLRPWMSIAHWYDHEM